MKPILRTIRRGLGTTPECGPHPGTGIVVILIGAGVAAGWQSGGWKGALFGLAVSVAVYGPMYLYGAYERGNITR